MKIYTPENASIQAFHCSVEVAVWKRFKQKAGAAAITFIPANASSPTTSTFVYMNFLFQATGAAQHRYPQRCVELPRDDAEPAYTLDFGEASLKCGPDMQKFRIPGAAEIASDSIDKASIKINKV